ncbi:MAG: carboxypeptidase-like regulatory domain-containing protein, partial [Alphaproteobacteria bacterium]
MSSSKMLAVIGGLAVIGAGVWYANDQGMLGGVVMGPDGPEAGVWVIAETNDLPTYFVRSVVTDDEGHFVLPDLPEANYEVWARGYDLLDSEKTITAAGVHLTIEQIAAPDARTAAEIYPALYWGSLLEIPEADEFPGTGDGGNGINPDLTNQGQWLHLLKSTGCYSCHQFGNEATRTLLPELGDFDSSVDAWTRRIQSGQASASMVNPIATFGAARALAEYADWTDRIAAG